MKKQMVVVLAIIVVAGSLVTMAQWATKATVEVPFSFIAAGKTFHQGTYEFNPSKYPNWIHICNTQTSETVFVPVAARRNSRSGEGPVVVFDKIGNDRYFSELYLPRIDGFAAEGSKEPHTHVQLVKGK